MIIFSIPIFTASSTNFLDSFHEMWPVASIHPFSFIISRTLQVSADKSPLSSITQMLLTSLDARDTKFLPTHSGGISYLLLFRKFLALIVGNHTTSGYFDISADA